MKLSLSFIVTAIIGIYGSNALPFFVYAQELPSQSQWSKIYTDSQAERGDILYQENCASCHGLQLEGTEIAPSLLGNTLTAKWNNRSLDELFDYQQALMPMNSPGGFDRQQNADILAYIFQQSNFPSGKSELPINQDAQRRIIILLTAPSK